MWMSRPRIVIVVGLFMAVALSFAPAVSAAPRGSAEFETTREEILASRRRRAKQLEEILDDARQRLADHSSGVRLLSETDKADLEKKINVYERKLSTMRTDLDDREVERILKREKLRDEHLKERRSRRTEL